MVVILIWIAIPGAVLLFLIAAIGWYLSPDASVLSKLRSDRYSLFEIVQTQIAALRGTTVARDNRHQQLLRIREQQRRHPDKYAAEFLAQKTREEKRLRANTSIPLTFSLLSRSAKLFVLT